MAFVVLSGRGVEKASVRRGDRSCCRMQGGASEVFEVSPPRWKVFCGALAGDWSGRLASFSATGKPLKEFEVTTTTQLSTEEGDSVVETREASSGDLLVQRGLNDSSTIGFEDGSFSWGPTSSDVPFEVESCMSFGSDRRLRVFHAFDSRGALHGIAICTEVRGKTAPASFYKTPALTAAELAGRWRATNLICQKGAEKGELCCTEAELERTYANTASNSPSLLLLPSALSSVVQPRVIPAREFSIGVGWLANENNRLVMIRRYDPRGKFTRTAYRTEKRVTDQI